MSTKTTTPPALKDVSRETLDSIARRAHYLATQMIFQANNRDDKEKGDPKIGGHVAACASALHIMGALHLLVKSGFDHIANKPHASPVDHSYNYLLDLLLNPDLSKYSQAEKDTAMMGLRKYSKNGEPVFQSYHSAYDSDHHNFFPSGTVGIPPVKAGYLALAYRFAREHNYNVPEAHFWALTGDSEFREGSMYEAVPDFADREIGNLTWIVDYNRQSLDGHRIINEQQMQGTDADRIERTMAANGWEVIQVRHGSKRQALFKKAGGDTFKNFLEKELKDYELQALLLVQDMKALKKGIAKEYPNMKKFLDNVSDQELYEAFRDFGGHDMILLAEAMLKSKQSTRKPTIIIAHTLKGWGLKMAAAPGNHSALLSAEEMEELRQKQGLKGETLFAGFDAKSNETQFLKTRGEKLYTDIKAQNDLKAKNEKLFLSEIEKMGSIPEKLDINTKMASYPHTQWMLGQLTAKLTRIANADSSKLNDTEKRWKLPGELFMTMAPDVGTSTNLNPAMDGKIFGAPVVQDVETELGVKDTKLPDLIPGEEVSDRFLRFEIAEGNVMSCVGAFGKMRDILGVPIMPLMTVYDFFIKRALDQYFYNLYWKSSFICVGTPSGVTLSPEGAQHGWKSDFQIPNQITWEPYFCVEVDWILSDTFKRHLLNDNTGRQGTLLRLVTRGVEQKDLMKFMTKQARFKQDSSARLHRAEFPIQGAVNEEEIAALSEQEILTVMREEVLKGAYRLIDYRGYAGYEPGDNVVNIFAMGAMVGEAIKASENLLARGIYANVIAVTSPDLLCGILAHENDYHYLRNELEINSNLYLNKSGDVGSADLITVSGRRVPVVSVHDGEAGLLDNLGSIVGVRHESCAVRKHSKCGRPSEIYHFHHIDEEAIVEACGKVLSESALEKVIISKNSSDELTQAADVQAQGTTPHWTELWPTKNQTHKH
ncbi:pyruvate dehydrogenase E1 component [Pseudobdellovibrio exovorus]|uniref:Pyruvate dehydrogenase E1 component n=1 Tax=Pseudobdellovibrio exovorus JSS TaxID=1184267 RepID=M4VAJ8_9BACT|nr:pyruvate dehydrogenase E1 component [Pseudobdellovibrio exovorus]AGH96432.1 pyruvate dehydrogenase E1 component [Pseudobdellovibrio exovorus JSS]